MLFKKKHCKMHDDLQELQFLNKCLKEEKIKLAELGKKMPTIEPYHKYDGDNPWSLSMYKAEHFSIELIKAIECLLKSGTSEGRLDPFMILEFLPKESYKYLKDLGNYLIYINYYHEQIENKKQEIKDLENQIEKKKKKLGID